ncbi:MEDS domain-containing protein [Blastococcus sp. SYSU D00695]
MTAPRQLGSPTGLAPGDHVCWSFADEAELGAAVLPFLGEGRLRGEKLLLVGPSRPALLDALAGLPDRDRMLADGRLEIRGTADGYAAGAVSPADQVERYRRETAAAVAEGHTGLRVAADISSLARADAAGLAALHAYEQRADVLMGGVPMTALCLYDEALGADVVGPIVVLHPAQHHGDRYPLAHLSARGGVLALHGEVDVSQAEAVGRALRAVAADAAGGMAADAAGGMAADVVLDLAGLQFLDVAGARALAGALADLAERGVRVRPVGVRRAPRRVLELFGLAVVPAEDG